MADRRYFDKNLELMLRPERLQLMLDKFCGLPEYASILDGKTVIDVYTQNKTQLEGTIALKAHGRPVFTCMTPGMPNLEKGGIVLLVPRTKPTIVLVQATVDELVDTLAILAPIDPRRRARYRTRMPAQLYGANESIFEHIKTYSARVFREEEMARPMGAPSYPSRYLDKIEDPSKITYDGMNFVGKGRAPHQAILADISEGGCCLYVHRDAKVEGLSATKFIFVMIEMPHPTKVLQAKVFASVRKIRIEQNFQILHCMFIEPLPQSIFNF
jgi:hypothetical protein